MDKSAALVSILTLVNPNSAGISPFINSVRSLLKDFSHSQQYTRFFFDDAVFMPFNIFTSVKCFLFLKLYFQWVWYC